MPIISEIVRFVLPTQRRTAFAHLRGRLARHSAVRSQYFGPSIAASTSARQNEVCWVFQWHGTRLPTLHTLLDDVSPAHAATSLIFEMDDSQALNVEQALGAPICQFATIRLQDSAPINDKSLQHAMHKTYTDCYLAEDGFVGGDWAYAVITNNVDGVPWAEMDVSSDLIKVEDRRLGVYALGWTSRAAHDAYSRTHLFDEEIDRLQPWFAPGTGAWYVTFQKEDVGGMK